MAIKESLEENKQFILDSLPSEDLKKEFLDSLEKVEEKPVSLDEQVKEAQSPDYVSEDMYDSIKKEIEGFKPSAAMSEDEVKAAIAKGIEDVDTSPKN